MRIALNFRRVDPSKGGAETYVVDLCHRLVREGHDVDLLAQTCRLESLPVGVRFRKIDAPGWTRWQQTWNFARNSERALIESKSSHDCSVGFINTWHHDVLIPQGGVREASLDYNSMRFPKGWRRSAYVLGKEANPKAWIYRAIERRQYDPSRSSRVVAVSEMVRGHLERYHGVPRDRTDVIPNAIDAARLAVDDPAIVRADFRRKLGLGPGELVALFVGHNYMLKGLKPLLTAMNHRLLRNPAARPIHLIACGGGKPGPFRAIAEGLGLSKFVHLMGFLPDIRPVFHAADFFALPTYYDPCSLVVFEALACGLPVITTDCNGAGELIAEGREGFVVPTPDSIDALADALDRMGDDSSRSMMASNAARLGREQSFDRHVSKLIEVFERVARSKQGHRPTSRQRRTGQHASDLVGGW